MIRLGPHPGRPTVVIGNDLKMKTEGVDQLQDGRESRVRILGCEQSPHDLRTSLYMPSEFSLAYAHEKPRLVEGSDQCISRVDNRAGLGVGRRKCLILHSLFEVPVERRFLSGHRRHLTQAT